MRIPETAPDFDELISRGVAPDLTDPDLIEEFNQRYLHWDDLKHRDLDRDSVWLAMKLSRKCRLFEIGGTAFSVCIGDETDTVLQRIVRGTGDHRLECMMRESVASAQIEGSTVQKDAAMAMLRNERAPKNSSEKMVRNVFDAMRFAESVSDREMSPELIDEVHGFVLQGLMDTGGMSFRTDDSVAVRGIFEDVVYHQPVPAEHLSASISDLCRFVNEDPLSLDPLAMGILIHFLIAWIHPFNDGNGRTARALSQWFLMKNGMEPVPVSETILKHMGRYHRSFQLTETDGNDVTYFIRFNLDVFRELLGMHSP